MFRLIYYYDSQHQVKCEASVGIMIIYIVTT